MIKILRHLVAPLKRTMSNVCTRVLDPQSSHVKALLTDDIKWLCNVFVHNQYEIRVVGGAVRDMLRSRTPKDVDLATTATPDEMIKIFTDNNIRYIETGLRHGTLTAHINDVDYEITTLRIDTETDGRKAVVKFTKDWLLDSQRRDFTINAMSLDINGVLYDYFDGEQDLKDRRIRFVGEAQHRITEDYLRILRYFRFYGKICLDAVHHEPETLNDIKRLSRGLQQIAVERIWIEVKKIMVGPNAPHLIEVMYNLDVSKNIGLPNFSKEKISEFSKVWNNMKDVNPEAVTLLCTLIDTSEEGKDIFLRWKLSNFEKDLGDLILTHRYSVPNENSPLKPYQDFIVSRVPSSNRKKVIELLHYEGKFDEAKLIEKWEILEFPVLGVDLKKCGIKPGPAFGRVLNELKRMWIDSYYTYSKDYLLGEADMIYNKIKN